MQVFLFFRKDLEKISLKHFEFGAATEEAIMREMRNTMTFRIFDISTFQINFAFDIATFAIRLFSISVSVVVIRTYER